MNQDPIGLVVGDNLYRFAPNGQDWLDPLGLDRKPNHRLRSQRPNAMRDHHTVPQEMLKDEDFVAQLEQCGLKNKKVRRQFIDQQIVRIDAKNMMIYIGEVGTSNGKLGLVIILIQII